MGRLWRPLSESRPSPMAEIIMRSANLERPFLSEPSARIRAHILALLLALVGALIAATAIHAPVRTVVALGGLLSVGLTWLMRRRAWFLLCCVVIPAIGAGELWMVEIGGGTLITPSLLVVAVWATGFFLAVLFEKDQSFWRLPLVGSFAVFWLAILLSVINSVSVLHWARGLLEAILGFAFFAYPNVYLKNREQLSVCLRVLSWLAVFTVVFGVLQYSAFDSFGSLFPFLYSKAEIPIIEIWQARGRMVANWLHPSDFGSLLNIVAPIALYSWLNARKNRLVPLLVFLLIATGIFLTATRTPIIAFCLSSALLCFLMRGRRAGLLIMTGAAILLLLGPSLFSIASQRFQFSEEENVETLQGRSLLWLEAVSFFVQHPAVGIGARNFPDRTLAYPGIMQNTHNVYLETAAETGAIGLLAFIYLLYRALRVDFNGAKTRLPRELQNLRHALLCSSLAIMVESLTDNDFYVWQVWCLFWLIRGLSAAIAARPEAFVGNHATATA
jgi:O-antigen ligase